MEPKPHTMPFLDPRSGPSYGALEHEERYSDDEVDTEGSPSGVEAPEGFQEGVQKIEAINLTWTMRSLIVAYVRSV